MASFAVKPASVFSDVQCKWDGTTSVGSLALVRLVVMPLI